MTDNTQSADAVQYDNDDIENASAPQLQDPEELLEALRTQTATVHNLRSRSEVDKQQAYANGVQDVITFALITHLDEFQKAVDNGDLTGAPANTFESLKRDLSRYGLRPYGAVGENFDPNIHDAVRVVNDAEVDDNTVRQVLRNGYMLNGKVLRAATVVVSRSARP